MYCVDYQMSYPLLVVPYAPLKAKEKLKIKLWNSNIPELFS